MIPSSAKTRPSNQPTCPMRNSTIATTMTISPTIDFQPRAMMAFCVLVLSFTAHSHQQAVQASQRQKASREPSRPSRQRQARSLLGS